MALHTDKQGNLAVVDQDEAPSVGQMLGSFLKQNITKDNVDAFAKLIELHERQQARDSEREFAKAFSELQASLVPVVADKAVPNNDQQKSTRYRFASYETIMEQVRPLLQKHGFSVTFSMAFADGRVTQTCILQHIGGHSRKNDFTVRIGKGPPGSSEAQGDGAASTYAKRFAFCNALNITVETDTDAASGQDARLEGAFIGPDKVAYLKEQVKEVSYNETLLFKLAGCLHYEEITEGKYQVLLNAIEIKRSRT